MNQENPNAANRKATQPSQPATSAQLAQTGDAGLDIADQAVVLEPREDVVKINQGDIFEPFVRQNSAKNEANP